MLVAFDVGPLLPWSSVRAQAPVGAGEVYVARDAMMGPSALLFAPSSQPTVEIQLNENPYQRDGIGFQPHPATIACPRSTSARYAGTPSNSSRWVPDATTCPSTR